jgi:hypothetical protein
MNLQITDYQPQTISLGGYLISRIPDLVPMGCRLLLGISTATWDNLDVTSMPARDMINISNMTSLLRVFAFHEWPRVLRFRLFLMRDNRVIGLSAPFDIPGPVEPHSGPLLPLPQRLKNIYKYLFLGGKDNALPEGHSRALAEINGIPGRYFWTTDRNRFETNPDHRGFSCVGYVAAVCGIRGAAYWGVGESSLGTLDGVAGVTSTDIVNYLGGLGAAMRLRNKAAGEILNFFKDERSGYFILWRQGAHTTMVKGKTVYEFVKGGYKESNLEQRVKSSPNGWSLAELLAKPALAE